jgi:hypothetical protein
MLFIGSFFDARRRFAYTPSKNSGLDGHHAVTWYKTKKDMATVTNNNLVEGLSGVLGNTLVFRNLRGKTVVSIRPRAPRRQSEEQRKNRDRFKNAAFFAKACMLDPQKKQYYQVQARKLALPNAYTAAITDFMRRPAVNAVTRKGERMMVQAGKNGFTLASVEVVVTDSNVTLATYKANLSNGCKNEWVAHLPVEMQRHNPNVMIVIEDQAGNIIRHSMRDPPV